MLFAFVTEWRNVGICMIGTFPNTEMSDQQKLVQITVAAEVHATLATLSENWCKLCKTG
jgi:hypothetical protein